MDCLSNARLITSNIISVSVLHIIYYIIFEDALHRTSSTSKQEKILTVTICIVINMYYKQFTYADIYKDSKIG